MTTADLAANQQHFQAKFRALRQLAIASAQVPPPDATIVRLKRLRCRFPDGDEAWEVRRIREWCDENCQKQVYIKWDYDAGFFTPIAHCADGVDATYLALRWK
jgi:hypothetical protein